MADYKIVYVDEYQDDVDDLLEYFDDFDKDNLFDIIHLLPLEDIDDMVEEIFTHKPDAIIVDFKLNDYKTSIDYNVSYNGVMLSEKINKYKLDFPCFILTSFEDDVIKTSQDVNIVYFKGILHKVDEEPEEGSATFVERIEHQIKHHNTRIEASIEKLNSLVKKAESNDNKLNAYEEKELIDLDNYIESTSYLSNSIPSQLKSYETLNNINQLINNTNLLLEELKDIKK